MKAKTDRNWTEGYLLRHLAGRYFLIKKGQTEETYRRPIEMDENGARFWEVLREYPEDMRLAAGRLAGLYGEQEETVYPDVCAFREEIRQRMGEKSK